MADQNITALPIATTPESSDQLLLVGATEEKLIDYDKLADAILGKIASKNFALDQGNKTLLQALNELNSNSLKLDYIECDINTVANTVIRITPETIMKGEVPKDDFYIPIVHAQTNTNEYEVSIRYDYPSWVVYSNVSQSLGIRFFKCTK